MARKGRQKRSKAMRAGPGAATATGATTGAAATPTAGLDRPADDGHRTIPPLLILATFLVYQPTWGAGFIWDDDAHITPPHLQSLGGLAKIWLTPGATQQYYPLTESLFWLQHQLWGPAPAGYHLTNILLHALCAVFLGHLLRRLKVPGAFLAAAIFALHPVHVESVAWITEQKNTLSGLLFLASALAYLRFDESRGRGPYVIALALAVLALLAKVVTLTLPFALLVVLWWRRGALQLRRDLVPLLPFVAAGVGVGLVTLQVEASLERPAAALFELGPVQQVLLAGRALWFYLGKLLWPAELLFFYPRWELDPAQAWQFLFPVAALALLATLVALRHRPAARAALAAFLLFGIIQAPMLGALDIYAFIYSFVADHWQYLGSTAIIAAVAAAIARGLEARGIWGRPAGHAACVALLAVLALLSVRQGGMYADHVALYRTTLEGNPDSWIAHNNLAGALAASGRMHDALPHARRAAELMPESWETQHNLARALLATGQPAAAVERFLRAAELDPTRARVHHGLGSALLAAGHPGDAVQAFQNAARVGPGDATARYDFGRALAAEGMLAEAVREYRAALSLRPDSVEILNNLGTALARSGQLEEALRYLERSQRLQPDPRVTANIERVRAMQDAN